MSTMTVPELIENHINKIMDIYIIEEFISINVDFFRAPYVDVEDAVSLDNSPRSFHAWADSKQSMKLLADDIYNAFLKCSPGMPTTTPLVAMSSFRRAVLEPNPAERKKRLLMFLKRNPEMVSVLKKHLTNLAIDDWYREQADETQKGNREKFKSIVAYRRKVDEMQNEHYLQHEHYLKVTRDYQQYLTTKIENQKEKPIPNTDKIQSLETQLSVITNSVKILEISGKQSTYPIHTKLVIAKFNQHLKENKSSLVQQREDKGFMHWMKGLGSLMWDMLACAVPLSETKSEDVGKTYNRFFNKQTGKKYYQDIQEIAFDAAFEKCKRGVR